MGAIRGGSGTWEESVAACCAGMSSSASRWPYAVANVVVSPAGAWWVRAAGGQRARGHGVAGSSHANARKCVVWAMRTGDDAREGGLELVGVAVVVEGHEPAADGPRHPEIPRQLRRLRIRALGAPTSGMSGADGVNKRY